MEAMACGVVPVCLRMRSGIPELVEDGVTGLVVDDREDGFLHAIERLHNELGLWKRLSQAGRARVESEFSHQISVERWADLFHRLRAQVAEKHPIQIPKRLALPPINPALASADPRPVCPTLASRLYRRGRMVAGRVRRRLLGQSVP